MKIALLHWHGLGDAIQLIPAVRKYKQKFPKDDLILFTLKRFGDTSKELLSGLSYFSDIYPILDDAWQDGPDKYAANLRTVINDATKMAFDLKIPRVIPLYCIPDRGVLYNKVFRFSRDLGVAFSTYEDLALEVPVNKLLK